MAWRPYILGFELHNLTTYSNSLPTTATREMSRQFAEASEAMPIQHIGPAVRRYGESQVVERIFKVHPRRCLGEDLADVSGVDGLFLVDHLDASHFSRFSLLTHSQEYATGNHVRGDEVRRPEQGAE